MSDEKVRSAKEKILCPLTFNVDADEADYCCRERCAWFDRGHELCSVLSQSARAGELIGVLETIAREMLESRVELQRVRTELAQIGGAIIHK